MRPVTKEYTLAQPIYSPYGKAKDHLCAALGEYCSYCEAKMSYINLEVEHVQPKSSPKYSHLETHWSNFLLACKNCNTIKRNKDVEVNKHMLPHLDDTFSALCIGEGACISADPSLSATDPIRKRMQKTIDLVGLDRTPPNATYADRRWSYRRKAWEWAQECKQDYEQGELSLKYLINAALKEGFWSVWMTVFEEHPEVRKELIQRFIGTNHLYFRPETSPQDAYTTSVNILVGSSLKMRMRR